ncbi:MAG: glycosyltransferase family 2 protein [Candidatus Aenigmatarchaeota archaeon]
MKKPKVSLVVTSYNRKDLIKKCLNSLLNLDYPNKEILIVDSGSKDGTLEMLRKEFSKIRLLTTKSDSLVEAHNLGIKETNGDYFMRVDDDLELDKNFVKELVKLMEKDKNIGVSGGKIYYPKTNTIWCVGGKINFLTGIVTTLGIGEKDKGQYDYTREVDYIGSLMFTRREIFDKIGVLDKRFSPLCYEDIDFCVRARKGGYKVVYVPTAVAYHYRKNRKMNMMRRIRNVWLIQYHKLKFLGKHFGGKSVV